MKRGSFGKLGQSEFLKVLQQVPALKEKLLGLESSMSESAHDRLGQIFFELRFDGLRKKHVVRTVLNPKSRPRHEAIDVRHYTSSLTQHYCDFFED